MKFTGIAVRLFGLISSLLAVPNAYAELIPNPDGMTVYDTVLHVNWLKNANLAGNDPTTGLPGQQFGVGNINPNGSMDYATAVLWKDALNGYGYLGHSDWTLPTTPMIDGSCSVANGGPNGNSFGYGCMNSDMGSLFYASLGLPYPNTAVPIPTNTVGPFSNFQPYL